MRFISFRENGSMEPPPPLPSPPSWISSLLTREEWRVPLHLMAAGALPLAFPLSQLCRFCEPLLPQGFVRGMELVELGDWLENREAVTHLLRKLEREDTLS